LTFVTASSLQIADFPDGGCGFLFVYQRIPVQIDSSEPAGYAEELKRAERIG
jgi:hypothetical protein